MIVPHFLSDQTYFAVIIIGMVGAINAPISGANTFANFQIQASQATTVDVSFSAHLSSHFLMITLPAISKAKMVLSE